MDWPELATHPLVVVIGVGLLLALVVVLFWIAAGRDIARLIDRARLDAQIAASASRRGNDAEDTRLSSDDAGTAPASMEPR